MEGESLFAGAVGLLVVAFLLVLALLWFLLPFAVFGIKDLLQELIRETRATRELLLWLTGEVKAGRFESGAPNGVPSGRTGCSREYPAQG